MLSISSLIYQTLKQNFTFSCWISVEMKVTSIQIFSFIQLGCTQVPGIDIKRACCPHTTRNNSVTEYFSESISGCSYYQHQSHVRRMNISILPLLASWEIGRLSVLHTFQKCVLKEKGPNYFVCIVWQWIGKSSEGHFHHHEPTKESNKKNCILLVASHCSISWITFVWNVFSFLSFMSVFARKFKTLLILYTTYHMNILYF